MIVRVEPADRQDLPLFARLEQETDTREFITPQTLEVHDNNFSSSEIIYLRILSGNRMAGFILLALDPDGNSVEFRRIVIARGSRGIGKAAIAQMEDFCRLKLGRSRIYLDVFENNARARHVYENLAYSQFDTGMLNDKPLVLYEKKL